jgi:hypothetical protein
MDPATCPQCHRPLPQDAPHGLCPAYLLNAAFTSSSAAEAPEPPDAGPLLETVRHIGDYELLEEIARGVTVVYKARQVSLNRVVALKKILAGQLTSANDVARSAIEATSKLGRHRTVPIYEVCEHQGQHYFSMRLVEGGNLLQAEALVSVRRQGGASRRGACFRGPGRSCSRGRVLPGRESMAHPSRA